MSPKRQVALMVIIFSTLGVGFSVGIIASGGGFTGPGPSIFDPPGPEDIWQVGANINDAMTLDYSLTGKESSSSLDSAQASMNFEAVGESWKVRFVIVNGTGPAKESTITFSKSLIREGPEDESFRPYFDILQSSIFAVRDMDYGGRPKYAVVGAPWDTIFVGSSSVIVKVTSEETVQTPAGSFHAFVLSYELRDKMSKIWVVRDMPLPVKAEVYDAEDQLQYKYELLKTVNAGQSDRL